MLNLSLEQVQSYAAQYKAVPVAKEVLADMLTPLAFLDNVRRSSRNFFCWRALRAASIGRVIPSLAMTLCCA